MQMLKIEELKQKLDKEYEKNQIQLGIKLLLNNYGII